MTEADEVRYVTPVDPGRRRRILEEAAHRLSLLTPEQREALRKEREARIARMAADGPSPRRIVRRVVDEDGTVTLERADGSRLILKPAPKTGAE